MLAVKRFIKYSTIGFGTFLLDLASLAFLTQILNWNPVVAAAVSFLVAVSINYSISRKFVFYKTTRDYTLGYVYFIFIVGTGLLLVTVGMYVLVQVFGMYYLLARTLLAIVTGIWNYSMNLFFNFKLAGIH